MIHDHDNASNADKLVYVNIMNTYVYSKVPWTKECLDRWLDEIENYCRNLTS